MTLNGSILGLNVDGTDHGIMTVILPASNNFPFSVGSTAKNTYPFTGDVENVKLY